jgi:hypothetical protein
MVSIVFDGSYTNVFPWMLPELYAIQLCSNSWAVTDGCEVVQPNHDRLERGQLDMLFGRLPRG